MKHPEIDEQEVVEHYVAGKLTADEEIRFEKHYLECPACVGAVEDAERLRRGLELVATEALVTRRTIFVAAAHVLRSPQGALMASVLLVAALLPAGLAWQRAGRLDAELDAARQELTDERRPRINTPILALVATRAGEQPLQRVSLALEPEWIMLAVELGDTAEPRYTAVLTANDGAVVWPLSPDTAADLVPSYRGTVTLSLLSSLLPPGRYVLSLRGETQQLSFPLQVVLLTP